MTYQLTLILSVLIFLSCGSRKRVESGSARLRSFSDTTFFRQTANRFVNDRIVVRDIRLSAPDSSGKQFVIALTETHHDRMETDTLRTEQLEFSRSETQEVVIDKQVSVPVTPTTSFPFIVWGVLVLVALTVAIRWFWKR